MGVQPLEIGHAPLDVLLRIEGAGHPEALLGLGNELHQPLGILGGDGAAVEVGFGDGDGQYQPLVDAVALGGVAQHVGQLLFGGRLAGQIGLQIEGGGGDGGEVTAGSADAAAALIPHHGIADPAVVVTDGLLVAKTDRHGQVGVGHAGVANRARAGGEQAADAKITFRVTRGGGGAVEVDGLGQVALTLCLLTLLQCAERLGRLSEIPALRRCLHVTGQQQR